MSCLPHAPTSSVPVAEVGEPPHVAQPHSIAHEGEDELDLSSPLGALLLLHTDRSWVSTTTMYAPILRASLVQGCFTSTETIRLTRDGEPRRSTSTFTQLLSSDLSSIAFRHLPPNSARIRYAILNGVLDLYLLAASCALRKV